MSKNVDGRKALLTIGGMCWIILEMAMLRSSTDSASKSTVEVYDGSSTARGLGTSRPRPTGCYERIISRGRFWQRTETYVLHDAPLGAEVRHLHEQVDRLRVADDLVFDARAEAEAHVLKQTERAVADVGLEGGVLQIDRSLADLHRDVGQSRIGPERRDRIRGRRAGTWRSGAGGSQTR